MLKQLKATLVGGNNQTVQLNWSYDFQPGKKTNTFSISNNAISEFGVSEFGIAEFTTGIITTRKKVNASGQGEVVIIGMETDVNGQEVSLQEISVFATIGRLL
jgi:hypothetical protein